MFGMKVEVNEDGTIKDLPPLLKALEILRWLAQWYSNPIVFAAFVQWISNTMRAERRHRIEHGESGLVIPSTPVKFEVFNFLTGVSCVMITNELRGFSIPCQLYDIGFELWPDRKGIGLYYAFLVPRRQAWLARVVLEWTAGGNFVVLSSPGAHGDDRGDPVAYAATHNPWQWNGAPSKARSFDEAITQGMLSLFGGDRLSLAYRVKAREGSKDKDTEVEEQKPNGEHMPEGTQKRRKTTKSKRGGTSVGKKKKSAVRRLISSIGA